ncbi:MAG TPA: DUF4215 domain-containing protein [Candidatus Binatia bacterium]|nr:DUF4215 domain-containing protein [Candidatus Binatia bacterium]
MSVQIPSSAARAASAVAAVLALAALAPSAHALSDNEIRCRDLLATAARYGASNIMKARTECVRGRLSGLVHLSTDCQADPPALGGTGTGDSRIDLKLSRLLGTIEAHSRRLTNFCQDDDPAKNVVPADVLDPASACGSATNWDDAVECAVFLGKEAADTVHARLDILPLFAPVDEGEVECLGLTASQARKTLFTLNLWRARCFRADDMLAEGGGVYDCDANITPPGAFNTTGWLKADKRLEVPAETLGIVLYNQCDKDLFVLGFEDITPDHSGGEWTDRLTLDDVFDSLNDSIVGAVTGVMAELFPVGNYCGDGSVAGTEACDDGNHVSNDGCDRDCSLPACANGAIDGGNPPNPAGEECDDGNTADGDGCTFDCLVERCGNGVRNLGWEEECDHGGESPACDDDCTHQLCGDGKLNVSAGEQCDSADANDSNAPDTCGDGSGPSLRGPCQLPFCQDAVLDAGEVCDAGAETSACDTNCTPASCGDGDVNGTRGETCDDGNAANDDSCPSGNPAGTPFCITATCGDGFACTDGATCTTGPGGGPEQCDGDGVTATCDGNCSTAMCGDGTLNPLNVTPPARASGEACDDGNLVDGDGCDGNCTITDCGNGVVTSGETCDDGNLTNGDGCDDAASGNCTPTTCGNGIVTPGESCDGNGAGIGGETATCDANCTAAACNDGTLNFTAGEDCDTAGNSATCDNDCTFAVCGDGRINGAASETCDGNGAGTGGETATCDANCTAAVCGDGTINVSAGEQCDDNNMNNGDGCDSGCDVE